MKASYCIIFSILISSGAFGGQTNSLQASDSLLSVYRAQRPDSLKVNTLHALFNAFLYNDVKRAKQYALEQLQLSNQIDFPKGIAQANYNLAVYYTNINRIDSARQFYLTALNQYRMLDQLDAEARAIYGIAILEYYTGNYDQALKMLDSSIYIHGTLLNDSLRLGGDLQLRGLVYSRKGNYQLALKEALHAVNILEDTDDVLRLADAYNTLAGIESVLENFEESIEYNLKALEIYRSHNDKVYEAQALNDIGNCYYYLNDYQKAIDYLEKSVTLSEEMNSGDLESTSEANLGKTYAALKQYDRAIVHLTDALRLAEEGQNSLKVAETLNNLGQVYLSINEPEKAVSHLNRAIALSDSIGSKESLRTGFFNRSASYEKLADYRHALSDYKQFSTVSDSILNTEKSRQIEELRTIFDMERKEQEIALQRNEIGLLEQTAKVNQLQRALLIAGIVSLLFLAGVGYYALRQKIRRTRLEKEKADVQLDFKRKELTIHALHLAKKNETLEQLKRRALELRKAENGSEGYHQLIRTINSDLQDDKNWSNFARYFEEVHKDFPAAVAKKYPHITPHEYRLVALIKMNLSSKEIANILNISIPGVKKARQRLRKKMNLQAEESLENAVLNI